MGWSGIGCAGLVLIGLSLGHWLDYIHVLVSSGLLVPLGLACGLGSSVLLGYVGWAHGLG